MNSFQEKNYSLKKKTRHAIIQEIYEETGSERKLHNVD